MLFAHPAWPLVDGALLVSKRRSPAPDDLLTFVRPLCRSVGDPKPLANVHFYTNKRSKAPKKNCVGLVRSTSLSFLQLEVRGLWHFLPWHVTKCNDMICCLQAAAAAAAAPPPLGSPLQMLP